jgi:HSP20 family molecular chaperone IbpA
MSPIPFNGSIPGRKPRGRRPNRAVGLSNPLGGLGGFWADIFKILEKTAEGVQNLNLGDLEKLAEAQGNDEARKNIKELRERLEKTGINLGDLLGKGFDLSKLIEFAAKHGGEFSQEFAGGKGIIQGGIRGRILGRSFGENLPLDLPLDRRESQETKFEVSGTRPAKRSERLQTSVKSEVREIEIDPIEKDESRLVIRGYLAGVMQEDIVCETQDNGTVLKISTKGERKYEKKVRLPSTVAEVKWSYNNGILEVVALTKKQG